MTSSTKPQTAVVPVVVNRFLSNLKAETDRPEGRLDKLKTNARYASALKNEKFDEYFRSNEMSDSSVSDTERKIFYAAFSSPAAIRSKLQALAKADGSVDLDSPEFKKSDPLLWALAKAVDAGFTADGALRMDSELEPFLGALYEEILKDVPSPPTFRDFRDGFGYRMKDFLDTPYLRVEDGVVRYQKIDRTLEDPFYFFRARIDAPGGAKLPNEPTMAYINRERRFFEASTRRLAGAQKTLAEELGARIDEKDAMVPYKLGGYEYASAIPEGEKYRVYTRSKNGKTETLLDVNAFARAHYGTNDLSGKIVQVGDFKVNPDGRRLLFTVDWTGNFARTLYEKDLETGQVTQPGRLDKVSQATWSDNNTIFAVTIDPEAASMPNRVVRVARGADPVEVYKEKDPGFFVGVDRSDDGKWIVLRTGDHFTSEVRLLSTADTSGTLRVVRPREKGVLYRVALNGDSIFMQVNRDLKARGGPQAALDAAGPSRQPDLTEGQWKLFDGFEYRLSHSDGQKSKPIIRRRRPGSTKETLVLDVAKALRDSGRTLDEAKAKLGTWQLSPDQQSVLYTLDSGDGEFRAYIDPISREAPIRTVDTPSQEISVWKWVGHERYPVPVRHIDGGSVRWSKDGGSVLYVDTAADAPVRSYDPTEHRVSTHYTAAKKNFQMYRAPADALDPQWELIVPESTDTALTGMKAFAKHLVVQQTANGSRTAVVYDKKGEKPQRIDLPDAAHTLSLVDNLDFNAPAMRFQYTSLLTPKQIMEYDFDRKATNVLKKTEVHPTRLFGAYDPKKYQAERITAKSKHGGPDIPVTLVYRKDKFNKGKNPLLIDGYGAYGTVYPLAFSPSTISMMDRGVVCAIAHVRGGGERGPAWHEAAIRENKWNTFHDFIDVRDGLVERGYAADDRVAARGGSAGGMIIGAMLTHYSDKFKALVARVPFWDELNTMSDEDIPLTAAEWPLWGNPSEDENAFDYIRSYSGYDNLNEDKAYPALWVEGGIADAAVQYFEPLKVVAALRTKRKNPNEVLLNLRDSGHGGASSQQEQNLDAARGTAWILEKLGAPVESSDGSLASSVSVRARGPVVDRARS